MSCRGYDDVVLRNLRVRHGRGDLVDQNAQPVRRVLQIEHPRNIVGADHEQDDVRRSCGEDLAY